MRLASASPPRADAPTALALVVAAVLPSVLTWWYFVGLAGPESPALLRKAVYAGGKVAQFALPLAFVLLWERRRPWPSRPRADGLLLGTGFGLAVAAGVLALYFGWLRDSQLLARSATPVLTVLRGFGVDALPGFLVLAASLSVANSLFEEYYYRWFVFCRLRAFMPLPAALVVSALVFMAHHVILLSVYLPGQFWTLAVPLSLCVACGGGLWAWLYARTKSIYAPWLSHAIIDAAVFAVGWDLMRRGG
jgi:membrane protease YdiL (CAAX protease family)